MQHKCKVTVLDKKVYPELQSRYCADPGSGACPCYNAGDEYVFERYGSRDDFWHMGAGTLVKGSRAAPEAREFRTAPRPGTPSPGISTRPCREGQSCAAGWRTSG